MADEQKKEADEAAPAKRATDAEKKDEETAKETKSAGPSLIVLLAVSVIALSLGVVTGGMVIGPRFTSGKPAPAVHAAEPAADLEEPDEGGGGHGEKGKKGAVLKLENIIVNPSGSQGTRFLMVTVALEVGSSKAEARLREREDQVRDAVIGVLEHQTMEALTQPGVRDRIKSEIGQVVRPLAGTSKPPRVYLPQFVIQ